MAEIFNINIEAGDLDEFEYASKIQTHLISEIVCIRWHDENGEYHEWYPMSGEPEPSGMPITYIGQAANWLTRVKWKIGVLLYKSILNGG